MKGKIVGLVVFSILILGAIQDVNAGQDVPKKVTDLSLSVVSGTQVDLSWTPPDDGGSTITGYFIQNNVNGVITTLETSFGDATSTSYSDTTLSLGDSVTYRIAPINAEGQGPFSNIPPRVITSGGGGTIPRSYDGTFPVISLGFDHATQSQLFATQLMKNVGNFAGTLYVVVFRVDDPGFMTKQELTSLQNDGWEIASHSMHHRTLNFQTPTSILELEIIESKNELELMGFEVFGFIPPKSRIAQPAVSLVTENYDYLMQKNRLHNTVNSLQTSQNDNGIPFVTGASIGANVQLKTFDEVRIQIDKAIENNLWLVIHFHEINNSGRTLTTTPELFKEIILYLKEKSDGGMLEIMTQADALGLR